MCAGVVVLLAVLKFSTSPNMLGSIDMMVPIEISKIDRGKMSFIKKYGKNFVLSKSGRVPEGFDDPFL